MVNHPRMYSVIDHRNFRRNFYPAAIGSSVSFDYSYTLDPVYCCRNAMRWPGSKMPAPKKYWTAVASGDPTVEVVNTTAETFVQGSPVLLNHLPGSVINIGDANANIHRINQQPTGYWSAAYNFDGTIYTTTADGSINALSALPIDLNLQVGPSPAIGEYILSPLPSR